MNDSMQWRNPEDDRGQPEILPPQELAILSGQVVDSLMKKLGSRARVIVAIGMEDGVSYSASVSSNGPGLALRGLAELALSTVKEQIEKALRG